MAVVRGLFAATVAAVHYAHDCGGKDGGRLLLLVVALVAIRCCRGLAGVRYGSAYAGVAVREVSWTCFAYEVP